MSKGVAGDRSGGAAVWAAPSVRDSPGMNPDPGATRGYGAAPASVADPGGSPSSSAPGTAPIKADDAARMARVLADLAARSDSGPASSRKKPKEPRRGPRNRVLGRSRSRTPSEVTPGAAPARPLLPAPARPLLPAPRRPSDPAAAPTTAPPTADPAMRTADPATAPTGPVSDRVAHGVDGPVALPVDVTVASPRPGPGTGPRTPERQPGERLLPSQLRSGRPVAPPQNLMHDGLSFENLVPTELVGEPGAPVKSVPTESVPVESEVPVREPVHTPPAEPEAPGVPAVPELRSPPPEPEAQPQPEARPQPEAQPEPIPRQALSTTPPRSTYVPRRSGAVSVGDEPAEPSARPNFRPDIEGLRAIAILLVVLYHAGVKQAPGGFVGVDVFFVISGFLITSQLSREVARTGRLRIGRFYARRVLRLLPAATLVIGTTLLATWWWLPATRLRSIAADALAANLYAINYRLAALGTDYRTATAAPSPLQHFWSLAVEEQFYLVVPVLLLATVVIARSRTAFAGLLALITAASLWWSVHTSATSSIWAYFGAPTRAWELGAGALLALGAGRLAERYGPDLGVVYPPPLALALRWGGLAAIAVAALRFGDDTVFPGIAAALPVLGAVAVIASGTLAADGGARSLLGAPVMTAIGARSYSWYLWHWPVLLIGPFVVSREFGPIARLVAVLVALGLAAITFVAVEQPLRDAPTLRARPRQAGALGLALTATVVALGLLLPYLPSRTPLGVGSVADVTLSGDASAQTKALAARIRAAGPVRNLPLNVTPSLTAAAKDDPVIYRDGCHLGFSELSTPRRCERFGDPRGKSTMVLFGDSHAAQWYPAMNAIARKRHQRLAVFTKGACSAADVMIYLPPIKRNYSECVTWRKSALRRIAQLHPTIVVASSNADGGDPQGLSGSLDRKWSDAWSRSVRALTRPGTRVVYLNDTPWPKTDVPECLAEHPRSVPRCAQSTKRAAQSPRRTMMARAASKAGATVVDPMPWFCSLSTCPVVVGNILVYKDDSHVSTVWSKLLAPVLAEQLRPPAGRG
jgi:peptidoglycan/LPS O-acetylase OafA/YrhL